MGRKRWWRGGLELLVLCVLIRVILGDGEVASCAMYTNFPVQCTGKFKHSFPDRARGCLFSKDLCDAETESCYNDLAFGRCIPFYTDEEVEDLYQYDLEVEELELLRLQLERLEADGYNWPHLYTQCIMQTSLYNLRYRLPNDFSFCRNLRQRKDSLSNEENEIDTENGIRSVAVVKFTPSDLYPHGDYADEVYYPPEVGADAFRFPEKLQSASLPPMYQSPSFNDELGILNEETGPYKTGRKLKRKTLEYVDEFYQPQLYQQESSITSFPEYVQAIKELLSRARSEEADERNFNDGEDNLEFLTNELEGVNDDEKADIEDYEKTFTRKYRKLRQRALPDLPERYPMIEFPDKNPKWLNKDSEDAKYDNDNEDKYDENAPGDNFVNSLSDLSGMYTEGGIVLPLRHDDIAAENPRGITFDDDLNSLLWSRELAGFKRRERLDVKKPGPLFATNNYAFKTQSHLGLDEEDEVEESKDDNILYPPLFKKELSTSGHKNQDLQDQKNYKNVDLDHVYIDFEEPINVWMKASHFVNETERLAGLNHGDLTDIRVGNKELTFKVGQNKKNYTASDVVHQIEKFRITLEGTFRMHIIRGGIGDKAKLPPMFEIRREMSSSMFGAVIAMTLAAAAAASIVILVIARRHAKSRAKLAGLTAPDPEASKDYQELCRARMHAKQPNDKPDSPRVFPLISRVSESNNSPSNRSSTSSWGEEPALNNMDISTGHMVLSYMEDHLKNQDRLDEEWLGICAYEAEPCSTAIADAEGNVKLNRSGASLPYDHSRIILNDLANINNSDYINASTITDHDPRNPAYIATQGPLQETASDFWQLVWEQGSVVIVMLTRLTEEGKGMCYRYWPGEGSELYHIYEVHLVSEHIWCDDYLVRSFYLKNLRTGETRTVTQFHFLSWPENGVPHSTKALLEFRRKVNKSYRGRSCPIVVHCSDGAGRTGTYCLIDMVLNRMAKGAKEIDIAATLEHIRDQRPGMVSTKQQFEFVLMAVAEEVHAILKALPIPLPEKSPAAITSGTPSSSNSEQQQ